MESARGAAGGVSVQVTLGGREGNQGNLGHDPTYPCDASARISGPLGACSGSGFGLRIGGNGNGLGVVRVVRLGHIWKLSSALPGLGFRIWDLWIRV